MKKNIAVIGAGYWGQNLIRNFSELGSLKYIYDNDETVRSEFCDKYELLNVNFDEILDDQEIEGVVISTPAPTHYDLCLQCLEHDKHILVEKPITLNVEHAKELISKSTAKGKILMVGHLLQYHSHFKKFKDLVSEKNETPIRLYSIRKSLGKIRKDENVLWSFAPHDISMINSLIPGNISNISKLTKSYFGKNTDSVYLKFNKGQYDTLCELEVDWGEISKLHRLSAYFKDEILVFEDSQPDPLKKLYRLKIPFNQDQLMKKNIAEKEYITTEQNNPLLAECEHFISCINKTLTPLTNGYEALEVLEYLIELDTN